MTSRLPIFQQTFLKKLTNLENSCLMWPLWIYAWFRVQNGYCADSISTESSIHSHRLWRSCDMVAELLKVFCMKSFSSGNRIQISIHLKKLPYAYLCISMEMTWSKHWDKGQQAPSGVFQNKIHVAFLGFIFHY